MRGCSGYPRGFTLIEFIAVILLLSILVISAAPSLSGGGEAGLYSGANIIAIDIRLTQQNAIIGATNRSIRFDDSSTKYQYDIHLGGGGGKTRDLAKLGKNISVQTGATILFNVFGEPIPTPAPLIVTDGADSIKILIEPVTGKVTIE